MTLFVLFTFGAFAEGVLPYPGYWSAGNASGADNFQLTGRAITGLQNVDSKAAVVNFSARKDLIPARRGDFEATVDLIYDQYDGFFSGEVLFRILDAHDGLIAEGGLCDRWTGEKGFGKSRASTLDNGGGIATGNLPVKGILKLKFTRQKELITIWGNGLKLAEKPGNAAPAAKIEIFYQEYRGEKNHAGSFEFANIKVKNLDTTFSNGFDDIFHGALPPAWRLTRRVGTSGFEVADDRNGWVITGLKDFPDYPTKESTHVFQRAIQPLSGDFTATLDMTYELPPDKSFVGSVSLALLDANNQIIALTGISDGSAAKPAMAAATVGIIRQPLVNIPDKDSKEFIIRRRGETIDIFCGAMHLESVKGSTAPIAKLQLAIWIGRHYDKDQKLISSFMDKLVLRRIALIDHALPDPIPQTADVQRSGKWQPGKPITWYWAGPDMSEEFAAELALGNWNTAWAFNRSELDILHKYGLRGLVWMSFRPGKTADSQRRFKLWLESIKDHPAFFGLYLADEPDYGKELDLLGQEVEYLRKEFPGVMIFTNMHPLGTDPKFIGGNGSSRENYTAYMQAVLDKINPELISYDKYTFAPYGDESGYFVNLRMIRDLALDSNKPFMNIVQACTWTQSRRIVHGSEYRFLAYTTLAYGSQGLSCYVYSHKTHRGGMKNPFTGKVTGLYHQAREINREFIAIAGELQKLRSLQVYHAGEIPFMGDALPEDAIFNLEPKVKNYSDGKIDAIKHKADGKNFLSWSNPIQGWLLGYFGKNNTPTHVLLVNLDYNIDRSITLTAPSELQYFDCANQTWHSATGSRIKLDLPPGGGKLLRLANQE